jgi:hypothetical protein
MKTLRKIASSAAIAAVGLLAGSCAWAGYSCANGARLYVENGYERCSDGSIPIYRPDVPAPAPNPTPAPNPVPVPQPPADGVQRVKLRFVGTYTCHQGSTNLELQILDTTNPGVEALFSFSGLQMPSGRFFMRGGYDKSTGRMRLEPQRWIEQPPGWGMVGLDGTLNRDGRYEGRVTGHPSCTSFALKDSRFTDSAVQPSPQPSTDQNAACRWSGNWNMGDDWGIVAFNQQGDRVAGTFSGANGSEAGRIEGTLRGATLSGIWQRNGRSYPDGNVQLDIGRDCNTLSGRWKFRESGSWAASTLNATRTQAQASNPSPAPQPQPQSQLANQSGVAGLYWCVAPSGCAGTIDLRPDGSYLMNGRHGGSYSGSRTQVRFTGALSSRNNGIGRLDGDTMIFDEHQTPNGINYFAYRKGR